MAKLSYNIALFIILSVFLACTNKRTQQTNNDSEEIKSENSVTIDDEIQSIVRIFNQSYKTKGNETQNIVGFDYQGKSLIIKIETNSAFVKSSAIENNKEIVKNEIINKYKYQIWKGDKKFKYALKKLADMGISGEIQYNELNKSSHYTTINLSVEDFKHISDYEGDPTQDVLLAQIKAFNIHLPLQLDYCTILKKLSKSDGYLTYDYIIIEDEVSIEYFRQNKSFLKETLRQRLFSQCKDDLMRQAKHLGLGYSYRYKGDKTGKSFAITFSNSELE